MPKPVSKKKKTFRVFEAGSGANPKGLFLQAKKASGRGKKRHFVGVDIARLSLTAVLKKLLKRSDYKNLKLVRKCAVEAVKKLKPESQDIIFSSYLLNELSYKTDTRGISLNRVFLKEAKKALKPGGRIVLVQDKGTISIYREIANELGLDFHSIPLSDKAAKKSNAEYIRLRSDHAKREAFLNSYLSQGLPPADLMFLRLSGAINSQTDFLKPTIMILRKPRKKK